MGPPACRCTEMHPLSVTHFIVVSTSRIGPEVQSVDSLETVGVDAMVFLKICAVLLDRRCVLYIDDRAVAGTAPYSYSTSSK